jgi:hypothetical protein
MRIPPGTDARNCWALSGIGICMRPEKRSRKTAIATAAEMTPAEKSRTPVSPFQPAVTSPRPKKTGTTRAKPAGV